MDLFFSGATTSSPVKRRRTRHTCRSLDESLLSSDSSYVCYRGDDGESCCYRRSPRLLTNGYYDVTDDSFLWDDHGNVSLTECKSSVSYKENLVRVFRRRRRHRGALADLLGDVSDTCHSWLDQSVFRGVFGSRPDREEIPDREVVPDQRPDGYTSLDESAWSFTYDASETPHPSDKPAPPGPMVQEDVSSDQRSGLAEVPPPSTIYPTMCHRPRRSGSTTKTLLLLFLLVFIAMTTIFISQVAAVAVATTAAIITAASLWRRVSCEWRRAKTEDITSRNE